MLAEEPSIQKLWCPCFFVGPLWTHKGMSRLHPYIKPANFPVQVTERNAGCFLQCDD